MAGAHLDSVAGGPGINDNGSGTAALIEAAEAIGPDPRGAPVRLAFWGAEEIGLVGSRHYVSSLSRAERRRIRAYINLDMVGSPNALTELYVDGDPRLARALRRAAARRLAAVAAGGSSDHAPFQAAGIPVNGLYTGGPERLRGRPRDPCYHLACDTVRNVDRAVLLRMARAATRALRALSDRADQAK
jgi:aminopeptidase S